MSSLSPDSRGFKSEGYFVIVVNFTAKFHPSLHEFHTEIKLKVLGGRDSWDLVAIQEIDRKNKECGRLQSGLSSHPGFSSNVMIFSSPSSCENPEIP